MHVLGKDILKFHGVYWPAFLMAAGLELPERLLVHGHWLADQRKMSKSTGNVVEPQRCVDAAGVTGLRYFLLHQGVPSCDNSQTSSLISSSLVPKPLFVWHASVVVSCRGTDRLFRYISINNTFQNWNWIYIQ